MLILQKVNSSSDIAPPIIECGKDTVYVGSNMNKVTVSDEESYWEYDEAQYTYQEYMGTLFKDLQTMTDNLNKAMVELSMIVGGG